MASAVAAGGVAGSDVTRTSRAAVIAPSQRRTIVPIALSAATMARAPRAASPRAPGVEVDAAAGAATATARQQRPRRWPQTAMSSRRAGDAMATRVNAAPIGPSPAANRTHAAAVVDLGAGAARGTVNVVVEEAVGMVDAAAIETVIEGVTASRWLA